MPARASWLDGDHTIILYVASDPLTLDDLKEGGEAVWTLAGEAREPVDMIFDYRKVTTFPRGGLPVVREGNFSLPTLDRVALVGDEPLVEMMFSTLTRATYRPDPTIHTNVEEAAAFLRRMAAEDANR
jgi:hypothetical protein